MDLSSLSDMTTNGTLTTVIWSLFAGICLGIFSGIYHKVFLGEFIRCLLREKANTPEAAQTLDEAHLTSNPFIRAAVRHGLRGGGSYTTLIKRVDAPDVPAAAAEAVPAPEAKKRAKKDIDFSTARFYIRDEDSFRAEEMYDKRGESLLVALISVLAFLIVAFLSFQIIPKLITMIEDLVA